MSDTPEVRARIARRLMRLHSVNALGFLGLTGAGCLWSLLPPLGLAAGGLALWGTLLWEQWLSRRWMAGHDGPTPRGIRSMGLTRAIIAIGSAVVFIAIASRLGIGG